MTTQEKRGRGRPPGMGEGKRREMQAIIDFVRDFSKQYNYAPTLTEIAVGIGRSAADFGHVQPMVKQLIAEGFLVSAGSHQGRSIAVNRKPPRRYFRKPD